MGLSATGEVLRRNSSWVTGARLGAGRDPSGEVLDSLAKTHLSKTFYSYSTCTGYPFTAPTGEAAGLLWVTPLEMTDRITVSGGWNARHDWTEWGCKFAELGGSAELVGCSLWSET